MTQSEYDEGEHVKEVFAYFGRAFYYSGVLETGLALAIMQADFLMSVDKAYRADGGKSFDRIAYEAAFDHFMENQHAQTFGNLLKRISSAAAITNDLKAKFAELKQRRDFLVHHYFRERSVQFTSRVGRDMMIAELNEDSERFAEADKQLTAEMLPIRQRLGMTGQKFQTAMARIYGELGVSVPDEHE